MSEILKFIIENFSKLNALDFGLILATAVILSYGIYKFVSGLFHKRHEAQDDLIRLKEEAISSYQRQLQLIESERAQLEQVAGQRAKEIESLRQHLIASAIQQKFTDEQINRIIRNTYAYRLLIIREQQLLAAHAMCGSLKTMFAVYVAAGLEKRFSDLVREEAAFNEIEAIDSGILGLGEQLKATVATISGNPAEPISTGDENMDRDLAALGQRMNNVRDAFIAAFHRIRPEIPVGELPPNQAL